MGRHLRYNDNYSIEIHWEAIDMARNILVVEDDHNISDLIRMYLEK